MTSRRGFLGALVALVVAPMAVLRGKDHPAYSVIGYHGENGLLNVVDRGHVFSSATGSNVLTTGGTTDLALDPDDRIFYGKPYVEDIEEFQRLRNEIWRQMAASQNRIWWS